jgi:hypothetical protein
MKITLKREVKLESAIVYLKIKTEAQREDIKNYLSGNHFSNTIIERRVKRYLSDRGIYDSHHQLTAKGMKTRETGLVEEGEEGKYQIWYTRNDPVFGNRVFYFRRIKPDARGNPRLEPLDLNFDEKTFVSLPIWGKEGGKNGKEPVNFSVIDSDGRYQGENKAGITIHCTWIWNDLINSIFTFEGNLYWPDYDERTKKNISKSDNIDGSKEIDFNIDLTQYIPEIIPDWHTETSRCKLKMEHITTNNADEVYQYFEYSGPRPREGFTSCRYDKLPVEPYNLEEAHVWRNRLLMMELEKNYMHPDDFSSTVISINQKDGLEAYADQLDRPDIHQYRDSELEHGKKSDRGAAFWHLAAPLDLNMEIPQSLRLDSFSLIAGNTVSFRDIAQKFNGDFHAEKVFYFDSYVVNYYQQRSVAALLESFDVSDMRVITNKDHQYFNDYLAKKKVCVSVENIGSIYQNFKDAPHDRYLVLKKGNALRVWTGTNSIDYIRFGGNEDIQPDTKGTVIKTVTFTRVDQDVLESKLRNFILTEAIK